MAIVPGNRLEYGFSWQWDEEFKVFAAPVAEVATGYRRDQTASYSAEISLLV